MTLTYLQNIRALSNAALVTERALQVTQIGTDPEAEAHVADCDTETTRRDNYDTAVDDPPQGGAEIGE